MIVLETGVTSSINYKAAKVVQENWSDGHCIRSQDSHTQLSIDKYYCNTESNSNCDMGPVPYSLQRHFCQPYSS